MSLLFSKINIRGIEIKNRIIVSPMCQYSATDGFANEWHLVHLGSRAVGGAGIIIAEATAVCPEGRISINDLGLWKDDHIPCLKTITGFIRSQGSVPGVQLGHAGRKASHAAPWMGERLLGPEEGGWQTYAPSALAFTADNAMPLALTAEGIVKVKNDFITAAKRAVQAGYQVLELHAAHGYLLHQFLSPASNHRPDEYGGSFENRIRLLLEIVAGVRQNIPESCLLFVRISATDWVDGGWSLEESVALAKILKELGVDLIDCSSGGNVAGVKITLEPGYQVRFAETIKKESGILTGAVGLITTAALAEEILANGRADMILMGREFLRDPYFAMHAASELGAEHAWPNQYLRAKKK